MKPRTAKTTWIVVADGMHARFLLYRPGEKLTPAVEPELYDPAVHGRSLDLKSDHPGRAIDPGSGAHHAIEPRHDPHTYEKHLFAGRIADVINAAAARKEFDRLVIAAPPKTLGELRKALDKRAAALVAAEVHHDLIKTPHAELLAHFSDALERH
jgi:protein required for attachment to host cells